MDALEQRLDLDAVGRLLLVCVRAARKDVFEYGRAAGQGRALFSRTWQVATRAVEAPGKVKDSADLELPAHTRPSMTADGSTAVAAQQRHKNQQHNERHVQHRLSCRGCDNRS
jgi:hypothetical protein